jgi:hypothetical protein
MIIDYRFLDSYQLLGKEGSERSIRLISSTRNTRNTNIYSNYCEISGDGKRNDRMVPSVFRIFLCILCGLSKSVLSRARCQDQNISSIVVYSPLSQLTSLRPVSGIVSTAQPSSRMEEVLEDGGPANIIGDCFVWCTEGTKKKNNLRLICHSCSSFWVSSLFKILRPQAMGSGPSSLSPLSRPQEI